MLKPNQSTIYLLLALFTLLPSCKKDEASESCEDNQYSLEVGVYSWGNVKHPIPEDKFFEGGSITATPVINADDVLVYFSNIHVIVDDVNYFPSDSLPYLELDSLSIGAHDISISTSCTKEVTIFETHTCECRGTETYAEREIEIIEPTYIIFDSLLFSQSLGCNWDFPGNGCPELDFDFQYYDQELITNIFSNYDISDGPLAYAMSDTIAIYQPTCSFQLVLSDWDQWGESESIGQWTLDNSSMGGWQSGLYELEPGLSFRITKMD